MGLVHSPAAMSEFIAGLNGDCGETATLVALHALSPAFATTAAALGAIDNWEIGQKLASSNGSEPLSAVAAYLTHLGCQFINYGYSEPFGADWQTILKTHGGIHPVILEVADAGAGGGDEAGVRYHFFTQLDYLVFADGDNSACFGGSPVSYTIAQLTAKQICGVIVLTAVPSTYPKWSAPVWVQQSDGWYAWTANDSGKGMRVGAGMYQALVKQQWDSLTPAHGEEDFHAGAYSSCVVGSGTGAHVVGWDHTANTPIVGQDAAICAAWMNAYDDASGQLQSATAQNKALAAQVATLQQQLAAAQAAAAQAAQQPPTPVPPTPAPDPSVSLNASAIASLAAALAAVKAGA